MKKCFTLSAALLVIVTVLLIGALGILTGCRDDPYYVAGADDTLDSFPVEEILGATFYIGDGFTSDQAGSIAGNGDGTYTVNMRRRSPSYNPSAMFISGPFTFSDYYKIICEFPDNAQTKPYRVYAFASVSTENIDFATNSDYVTAVDLQQASFRDGVGIGTYELTNEVINTLTVLKDSNGNVRQYCSLVVYLYFNQADMTNPDDIYTFTLKGVRAANGSRPQSPVIRAKVYRDGEPDSALYLESPVLPDFNHRYDSKTLAEKNIASLNVCVELPAADAGKEFEFVIRNLGVYSGSRNLIPNGTIDPAALEFINGTSGASPYVSVSEGTATVSGKTVPTYTIRAKAVDYSDLTGDGQPGTGVQLKIPGPFSNTNRFTVWINLPRDYAGR